MPEDKESISVFPRLKSLHKHVRLLLLLNYPSLDKNEYDERTNVLKIFITPIEKLNIHKSISDIHKLAKDI